ncbi:MerC domain-containing protein [Alteromonas sediminis]|uniref:MerC domain-containing protein n=1 Tax=Alteromonas sediminis TaxID=2259342 RepID=A0A3N5YM49_9ALTE|nr:MerC domain-containing protein [Alteromonas sediminis]RPJ66341.1 MerC domain-containing protein [Alteromonas sediminis]
MHEAKIQSTFLDKCGIWISSLCAVHCLVLPVTIAVLPAVASTFFAQHWFERAILLASLCLGGIAMGIGILRHHGRKKPIYLLAAGGLTYWFKDSLGHDLEPVLVLIGAVLIIAGHTLNMRLIRRCKGCSKKATVDTATAAESASY